MNRNALLKKADRVFSLWVRARDRRCVTCDKNERLQCSHLIRRGKHSVRFDEINCHTQCAACNYRHNYNPEIYTDWFLKEYGLEWYESLVDRSKKLKKWSRQELEQIIQKCK